MLRRGGERFVETGDILRSTNRGGACEATVRRSRTTLRWFTGSPAGRSERIKTDELNDKLSADTWIVIAEPADEHRRTLGLFDTFIRAAPDRPVADNAELDVGALGRDSRRALHTLRWCDDVGRLSETGRSIVRYYRRLDAIRRLPSPAERVHDIGVGGFVKRAQRYDKPVVLDALLYELDAAPYEAELTAYRPTEAYIDFNGRAQDANAFLQRLQGLGFTATFREDGRFDVGADPSRITVDIGVVPPCLQEV